jgi:hypothetical protein
LELQGEGVLDLLRLSITGLTGSVHDFGSPVGLQEDPWADDVRVALVMPEELLAFGGHEHALDDDVALVYPAMAVRADHCKVAHAVARVWVCARDDVMLVNDTFVIASADLTVL